jgi:hypothetical protein
MTKREWRSTAWTLARIAGHSSVAISTRYVHPSEQAVLDAVERLAGHKIRHNDETLTTGERAGGSYHHDSAGIKWSGRKDLNLRPPGPEPESRKL